MNTVYEAVNKVIEKKGRIKLLGDSITHGVGGTGFMQNGEDIAAGFKRNPDGYCWAKRFKELMEGRYGCEVVNNACTGTTIEFILTHFDTLVSGEDDLVICTIGTNNRHIYFKDGPKKTPEELGEIFFNNVLALNERFTAKGVKVIFIANIPASEENEKDGADYWRILHMNDINEIYRRASLKAGFSFISMYDLFEAYLKDNAIPLSSLLCDGLHPNDSGYDVMLALITGALGISK